MDKLMEGIEGPEVPALHVGLANLGLGSPATRFVAGSALGVVGVWALRPSIAFDKEGQPLPFTLFAQPDEPSTPLPWWALSLLPGMLFALFV